MTQVTITFTLETELTGIEIQCIETLLIDECGAEDIKVSQVETPA